LSLNLHAIFLTQDAHSHKSLLIEELHHCSTLGSLPEGGGIRQLDVPDFTNGFGLIKKIVKRNGIKGYKKGQEAMRKGKTSKRTSLFASN
jgi:hypothetical protein